MMKFFRRFQDLGIEGEQAKMYDRNIREYRINEIKEEAKEAARYIKNGAAVIEVASGPGYLSIELAKAGKYKITGIDISKDLTEIADRNAKEAGVEVDFRQGSASSLPFQTDMFSFIICVLAFKNFKEPLKALNEMYRVLKPGGTVLIMDLNRNASNTVMNAVVKNMGLKGLNAVIARTIQRNGAYTREEFETFISRTDFKEHAIKDSGIGFSIYLKK